MHQTDHSKKMRSAARVAAIGLLALAGSHTATAQEATPQAFVGKWRAEWTTRSGKVIQADLEIPATGTGGWHTFGNSKTNTCAGRVGPVYVRTDSAEQVSLSIKMSETISGCDDMSMTLKVHAGGAPTGQWKSGAMVTLSPR